MGPIEYSKLHLYYNATDIFALPSQYREGFSRVVVEAALCGTSIGAGNIECLPEVVSRSVGKLIDPPSPENFAKVIEYFYANRDELESQSKLCADYAKQHFNINNAGLLDESYYTLKVN